MTVPRTYAAPLQRFLFRHGGRAVAAYILVAVLLNHIRRILAPWLGQFLFHHAVGTMKMARGSPHHLLRESLGYEWRAVLVWAAQAYGVSVWRRAWEGRMLAEEDEGKKDGGPRGWQRAMQVLEADVDRVVYLWLVLTELERAYVESCWAGAHLYALAGVFLGSGGPAERSYVLRAAAARWERLPLLVWLLYRWARLAAWPCLVGTVGAARYGRPARLLALGIVWAATAHLVRYSNKYFVLLEMSDMWVTFGWMAVGMVYVLAVKTGRVDAR